MLEHAAYLVPLAVEELPISFKVERMLFHPKHFLLAVQMAKHAYGAGTVISVTSTENVDFVKSLV